MCKMHSTFPKTQLLGASRGGYECDDHVILGEVLAGWSTVLSIRLQVIRSSGTLSKDQDA
jgi:hypothetical protein